MTSQLPNDRHHERSEGSAVSQFTPHAPLTGDVGGPMLMSHGEDATRLLLAEPIPCGSCGVMHTFFVNRGGKTRCFCCDQPIPRAREEFREFIAGQSA